MVTKETMVKCIKSDVQFRLDKEDSTMLQLRLNWLAREVRNAEENLEKHTTTYNEFVEANAEKIWTLSNWPIKSQKELKKLKELKKEN